MDTSKKYIEMCKAAEEIQFYATENYEDCFTSRNFIDNEIIWLPRVDQLAELLLQPYDQATHPVVLLTRKFAGFVKDNELSLLTYSSTFEQYWLKLYMQDKHNKRWDPNNKKWVEIIPFDEIRGRKIIGGDREAGDLSCLHKHRKMYGDCPDCGQPSI